MNASTLQPFAPGDVFAGATVLDDPNDDHAGRGRIIQYDSNLVEKGILWLEDSTHLVCGLKFDSRGRLWVFDPQSFAVLVVHGGGRVERRDFGARAYSNVNFAEDGSLYLGEHVAGDTIRPDIQARLGTSLPHMPGTQRFGDGHVWHFGEDGTFIKEYATQTHGGLAGFLGVTHAALSPDGSVLVYCSETGPRLMRYDLRHDRQLPDLQSFPEGRREMFFGMQYGEDGRLYVLRGSRIDVIEKSGATQRSVPLPGSGWTTLALTADGRCAYVGNFFSGEIGKVDLDSGERLAVAQTGGACSLAGIAVHEPSVTRRTPRKAAKKKPAAKRSKKSTRRRSTSAAAKKTGRKAAGKVGRRAAGKTRRKKRALARPARPGGGRGRATRRARGRRK